MGWLSKGLAIVALLGAASPLACGAESDELMSDDSELGTSKPIALHYGWLQSEPYRPDADPKTIDAHPTASSALIAAGVENVVVTSKPVDAGALAAWSAAAADWKAHGGVLARHATPNEIANASEGAGLAAFVKAAVADGFAYVAVDELEPVKAARLHDGMPAAKRVADELHAMNNDPGLRQRVIVYANSYNMVDDLQGFSTMLRACRDFCRVFASEVYLGASEAFVNGAVGVNPDTGRRNCANGIACIGYFANAIEKIAPGIGGRTITVVGTSASYLKGKDWEGSYCWGPKGGALRAELAKVRALGQPGVGTYSDTAVASDAAGLDFVNARNKYAGCFRGLVQQASFDAVKPALPPDGYQLPNSLPVIALPDPPTACGRVDAGQGLGPGDGVSSCNGRFRLVMQGDGNLALYELATPIWSTATNGKFGYAAVMQGDGNFVLYGANAVPLWSSATDGMPGGYLAVRDDGDLVVYQNGTVRWGTGTAAKVTIPTGPTQCGALLGGQGLATGQQVGSCDGRFALVMQTDGNLVLYMGTTPLWHTHTNGLGGYAAWMQGDGNFVLYRRDATPLFNAATAGNAGARLAIQNDGNLVVYTGSKALWQSGTSGH